MSSKLKYFLLIVLCTFAWQRNQGPENGMLPEDEYRLLLGNVDYFFDYECSDVNDIRNLIFRSLLDLNINDSQISSRIKELLEKPFMDKNPFFSSTVDDKLSFESELILYHKLLANQYLYDLETQDIISLRSNLDRILLTYSEKEEILDSKAVNIIILYSYLELFLAGQPKAELMADVLNKLEDIPIPRRDMDNLRILLIAKLFELIPEKWAEYSRFEDLFPIEKHGVNSPAIIHRQNVNQLFDILGEQHYLLGISPLPWLNATLVFPTFDKEKSLYICKLMAHTS